MLSRSSLVAGVIAITGYYGLRLYSSTSLSYTAKIKTTNQVPNGFAQSFAVSAVNPHRHITIDDTRSTLVSVSHKLSHEQILAKFLAGFFNGNVFAPERTALRLVRRQLVNFKELADKPISTQMWATGDIDEARLPPLHSIIFGAFRIVDIKCSNCSEKYVQHSEAKYSYIDIAFGGDDSFIAGVHRFSVSESEGSASIEGKRPVTISFNHISCNPKEDKPLGPDVLQTLHLWYAMLLFREGIVSVLKAE
ncbi:hypothetical protein C7974DRAFT_395136 [Boeremia exigua]|uniref:uncharacterized protein n=1 Tax=Boeremia exigua TaxID=749465 RepID=UPI001E8DE3BF|nr:uncharacterized protein C7974DRAFT_395136 [Boeremia exigua]KAH6629737.1 hypothetical protein C7974DRAFT_395136 [Boeremia exigua]